MPVNETTAHSYWIHTNGLHPYKPYVEELGMLGEYLKAGFSVRLQQGKCLKNALL